MDANTEWIEGFKVLRPGRVSAFMFKDTALKYEPYEETVPQEGCGPLAVFGTYEDACGFALKSDRIWACRFKRSEDQNQGMWHKRVISRFNCAGYSYPLDRTYRSAQLADAVIIEEEILAIP